jgi:hypothetical protein
VSTPELNSGKLAGSGTLPVPLLEPRMVNE